MITNFAMHSNNRYLPFKFLNLNLNLSLQPTGLLSRLSYPRHDFSTALGHNSGNAKSIQGNWSWKLKRTRNAKQSRSWHRSQGFETYTYLCRESLLLNRTISGDVEYISMANKSGDGWSLRYCEVCVEEWPFDWVFHFSWCQATVSLRMASV